MVKKIFKQFSFVFLMTLMLTLPFFALAQISNSSISNKLKATGNSAGFSDATDTTLAQTIGGIVSVALSFLGIIFVILVIVSGYQWMTAGGNEDQVTQAKSRIKNAIIGLVVVISAYAIWKLIDEYFLSKHLL